MNNNTKKVSKKQKIKNMIKIINFQRNSNNNNKSLLKIKK